MTAPLPERIERAKKAYRRAYTAWHACTCETTCAHEAAFDEASDALNAAIRDGLAMAEERGRQHAFAAMQCAKAAEKPTPDRSPT